MANTKTKSKFIYLYEHQSGNYEYNYDSLVDGVRPFDTEEEAKLSACNYIEQHSLDVMGEFEEAEWMIHVLEVQSATMYRLARVGLQLKSPKKVL